MSILPRSPTKKSIHQNHPTCTCPPAPRQALDVLGAHVLDRLDRDGEGDGGRQLPVVGDDLLRHRVAHLLISGERYLRCLYFLLEILCTHVLNLQDFLHRQAYLVDVNTARPQLAMANSPILLARHSLVLNSGLLLLSLLCWGLLKL